jgi:magnesium transporter
MPSLLSLLAEEGGIFENSFVSYPICRPSRSTTLIGPLLPKPPRNGPSWAEQYPARRARGAAYNAAMFVESAVYVDGRRTTTGTPGEACRACREPGKFAWINLREPSMEEFVSVAGQFGLDELAVEEAIEPDQRPKIERYGERLFVVLRSARYVEGTERVQFGEVHAFVAPDFIITVLYGADPTLSVLREKVEGEPDRLQRGPHMVLYEIMNRIVEGYDAVSEGLENDLDSVEAEVLGSNTGVSSRVHALSREVIRFHQATKPLAGSLERLIESEAGDLDPETRSHLRHVRDRVLRTTEQIEGLRDLLSSLLDVNLAMLGVQQNDQVQKLSAWGAILIIPTLIAGIFGMNFEGRGPWEQVKQAGYGFEISVLAMALICVALYVYFKRRSWL